MTGVDDGVESTVEPSHARLIWGTIAFGFALASAGIVGTQTGNIAAAVVVAVLVVLPGLAADRWSA